MKAVMPQLKGLADGNLIRQIVTEELASLAPFLTRNFPAMLRE